MRFLRVMVIAVLFLACGVLGASCAGARGVGIEDITSNDDGTITIELSNGEEYTTDSLKGDRGEQGEPGPNMIVAMGEISPGGNINQGYNVSSCTGTNVIGGGITYSIALTGIDYDPHDYVTLVTYSGDLECYVSYDGADGKLVVYVNGNINTSSPTYRGFSFVVLAAP
ncbi:MAG: hypothetical protein QUS33_08455 [Dehalococcoidia bacterium]|nr:hypothetical protein [Dehalococcoidia bacterium]